MTPAAARLGAALAALLLPRPPPQAPPVAEPFPSAAAALEAVLTGAPSALVLGFGELHQVAATAGVPSSLRRFTEELLPLLAPRASDLIVETWVADGRCGEKEAAVVADVARATERPQTTESEIVSLLRHAKEGGVAPHILRVSCDEYRRLASGGAAGSTVDYQRMLSLTEEKLEKEIAAVLAARAASASAPTAGAAKLVLVYGGALHNDLYPDRALAPFSYGPAIFRATGGGYVEVDLYVPEYLERNSAMRAERWYPIWKRGARAAPPGSAIVIRRSPASAIVVLPYARQR